MQGFRTVVLGSITVALALASMSSCAHAASCGSAPDAACQAPSRVDPIHARVAVVRLVEPAQLLRAKADLAPTLAAPAPTVRHLVDVRGLLKEPGIAPLGESAERR